MKPTRALLLVLALAASFSAAAQYQWIDKDGRRVFSDRAPPADIPAKNILSQPRTASMPSAAPAAEGEATGAAGAASAPAALSRPGSGTDKALEEKKKQAEAAEAAKQKAAQEQHAKDRAENCQRARAAKANLDSGMRIARTNEKGEREFMDDAQRASEQERLQRIIQADCGPGA